MGVGSVVPCLRRLVCFLLARTTEGAAADGLEAPNPANAIFELTLNIGEAPSIVIRLCETCSMIVRERMERRRGEQYIFMVSCSPC